MKRIIGFCFVVTIFFFSSAALAQVPETGPVFSFRGVLSGILENIGEKVQNVISAVRNPFSDSQATASQNQSEQKDSSIFSFAVMGDSQNFSFANPNGYFQKTVKNIAGHNPDLVFSTGDLVSSSDNYTEYSKKFGEWKKIQTPLLSKTYAAMGNHDNVDRKGVRAWQSAFDFPTNGPDGYTELAYSFDFKNSHFVVLASDNPDQHQIDKNQRNWLDQDLSKNKKENTFVFFHEPAYPTSSKIGESLDAQKGDRDALWSILEKHDVTAVFNGHEHIVSRKKIGKTYQFVFGSTDSFNHALPQSGTVEYANRGQGRFGIVEVNKKEITVKIFDDSNTELDSFTFSKIQG